MGSIGKIADLTPFKPICKAKVTIKATIKMVTRKVTRKMVAPLRGQRQNRLRAFAPSTVFSTACSRDAPLAGLRLGASRILALQPAGKASINDRPVAGYTSALIL